MVLEAGIEPACSDERGILSPLCLPIPPLKHDNNISLTHNVVKGFIKKNAPRRGRFVLSSVVSMSMVMSISTMIAMPTIRSNGASSTFHPTDMCARMTIQHVAIHILNAPSSTNPNTISSIISWHPNPSLHFNLCVCVRMWLMRVCV